MGERERVADRLVDGRALADVGEKDRPPLFLLANAPALPDARPLPRMIIA
jgi:hypothetical protein